MATDWEAFISDIEQGLRQLISSYKQNVKVAAQRIEISYGSQTFALEIRCIPAPDYKYKHPVACYALLKRNWIQSMLHHDIVICFYRRSSLTLPTESTSCNVSSAFTIATKAVMDLLNVPLPIFYAYDIQSDSNVTEITTGYFQHATSGRSSKKVSASMNKLETLSDEPVENRRKLSYECYLYENLARNRSYSFFDGIRRLYLKKILAINQAHGKTILNDNFRLLATNFYDYEMSAWSKHQPEAAAARRTPVHLEAIFTPEFLHYVRQTYHFEFFKGYSIVSISHVQVQLDYKERLQHSVLDNESYSTFVASRQPFHHFHIAPSYTYSKLSFATGSDLYNLVVHGSRGNSPHSSNRSMSPMVRPTGKVSEVATLSSPSSSASVASAAATAGQSSAGTNPFTTPVAAVRSTSDPSSLSPPKSPPSAQNGLMQLLECICWRSTNMRKLLVLFIASSLQLYKTLELSEDSPTEESHTSVHSSALGASGQHNSPSNGHQGRVPAVPPDLVDHIANHMLTDESRKLLLSNEDFQSYLSSMKHIASTMNSLSRHRTMSNISYNNINIGALSIAPPSSLPSAQPREPTRSTVVSGSLSYGYSNSPKIGEDGDEREEMERSIMQSITKHLFSEKPVTSLLSSAASEATALPSSLPSAASSSMEVFVQQLALCLSFFPNVRLSFVIKLWDHTLKELQEIVDGEPPTGDDQSLPRFLRIPSILRKSDASSNHCGASREDNAEEKEVQPRDRSPGITLQSASTPLYAHALWDDVIAAKQEKGIPCEPPNLQASLLMQKLQMIAFGLVVRTEESHVHVRHAGPSSPPRAACDPVETSLPSSPSPLESELGNDAESGKSPAALPAADTESSASCAASPAIGSIKLARRVPLTSDVIHLQQHIANKSLATAARPMPTSTPSSSSSSLSATSAAAGVASADPFLKYHVCMPSLLTDIRSFRSAYPNASVELFEEWYGLHDLFASSPSPDRPVRTDSGAEASTSPREGAEAAQASSPAERSFHSKIQELWEQAAPRSSPTSSPENASADCNSLFAAAKEIDKAIVYLEKVPINVLLLELFVQILGMFSTIINQEIAYLFHARSSSDTKLDHLLEHLQKEIRRLEETSMFLRKDCLLVRKINKEEWVHMTLQVIKQGEHVISLFESLEHLVIRGYAFNNLVSTLAVKDPADPASAPRSAHSSHPLDYSHIEEGRYTLTSEAEAEEILRIMRSISKISSGGHDWYSYDGREMGAASARQFTIKANYVDNAEKVPLADSVLSKLVGRELHGGTSSPKLGTPKHLRKFPLQLPSTISPISGGRLDYREDGSIPGSGAGSSHGGGMAGSCDEDDEEIEPDVEMSALVDQQQLRVAFIIRELD